MIAVGTEVSSNLRRSNHTDWALTFIYGFGKIVYIEVQLESYRQRGRCMAWTTAVHGGINSPFQGLVREFDTEHQFFMDSQTNIINLGFDLYVSYHRLSE